MPSVLGPHSRRAVRRSGHIVHGRADTPNPVLLDGSSSGSGSFSSLSMQSSSTLLSSPLVPSSSGSISSAFSSSAIQFISSQTSSAGNSFVPSTVTPSPSTPPTTSSSSSSTTSSLGATSVSSGDPSSTFSGDNAGITAQEISSTSTTSVAREETSNVTPSSTTPIPSNSSVSPTSSSSTSITSSAATPKPTSSKSRGESSPVGPLANNVSKPSSTDAASSSSSNSASRLAASVIPSATSGGIVIGTETPSLAPGSPVTTLSVSGTVRFPTPASTLSSDQGIGTSINFGDPDIPSASQGHAKTPIILAGVFGTLGAFIIFVILLFLWKHRRASSSSSTWHLSNFSWRQSAGPTLPLQMPGTTQRQTASPASLISRPQTTYSNGMLGPLPSSSSLGSSSAQSAQSNATDVSPRLVLDTKRLTLQRLEGNPRYTLGTSPSDMGDDPFADPLAIVRARGNRMEPSPTIRRSDASESSVYSTTYAAPQASTSNMLPNPFRDPGLSTGVYSQGSSSMPSPRSWRQSTQGSSNLRNEYSGFAV